MKPNILYIMSDDHAANAISCYDSILSKVFKTPNMDSIANEGCKMNAYCATNSICVPARASIMTGQYGQINGVRTLNDHWNPNTKLNLANLLTKSGYDSAMFGKWHLGCDPVGFNHYCYMANDPNHPCVQKGKYGQGGEQGVYFNPSFKDKKKGHITVEGYVTDIITDLTTDWLKERNKEKPFFVMCHHKAPHDFWEYPERKEHLFDGVTIPEPESLFEDRTHRSVATRDLGSSVTPRSRIRSLYEDFCRDDYVTGPLLGTENMTFEEKGSAAYQKYLKDYLRTVSGIDDSVGSILNYLKEEGTLDNTIVIYTSDQGMFLGEHDYQDKRWSFDESIRTPFLIRYPKEISAKTTCTELMSNIDVAPTLLDYAGVDIPKEMQGISCRKMISGQKQELHDAIYFRYWMHLAHNHDNPAHYGIRTKDFKITFYYGLPLDASGAVDKLTQPGWELYDLRTDPQELHNVYDDKKYLKIRKDLQKLLIETKIKYKDTDDNYETLSRVYRESLEK